MPFTSSNTVYSHDFMAFPGLALKLTDPTKRTSEAKLGLLSETEPNAPEKDVVAPFRFQNPEAFWPSSVVEKTSTESTSDQYLAIKDVSFIAIGTPDDFLSGRCQTPRRPTLARR